MEHLKCPGFIDLDKRVTIVELDQEQEKETREKFEEQDTSWKSKIDAKIDKILWFMLGQSFTLMIGLIVGVLMYVIGQ